MCATAAPAWWAAATASAISSGVVGRDGLSAFVAMGPVGATVMATGRGASNAAIQSSLVADRSSCIR
jgi:hypothetical protein